MQLQRLYTGILAGLLAMIAGVSAWAQEDPFTPTDAELELEEKQATMEAALNRVKTLEANVERLEKRNKVLAETVASANAQADRYEAGYKQIRLQMEALGVPILEKDTTGVEQRLLSAVNDLRLAEKANAELADRVLGLSEAMMQYIQGAVSADTDSRMRVEVELRAANDVLGLGPSKPKSREVDINRAEVASLKKEFGLLVVGAGKNGGARVGMPLQVLRDDKLLATATVVNVRNNICGALITSGLETGDLVQVGDSIRIDATNTLEE